MDERNKKILDNIIAETSNSKSKHEFAKEVAIKYHDVSNPYDKQLLYNIMIHLNRIERELDVVTKMMGAQ